MRVSPQTLVVLAALVWIAGGLSLLLKGGQLVAQAQEMRPQEWSVWLAVPVGMLLGGMKGWLVFRRACRRNMTRIHGLESPRLWQFYRGQFFLLLLLMIAAGAALSGLAQGSYPLLVAVACIDFSIATALLSSSPVFWQGGRRGPGGT